MKISKKASYRGRQDDRTLGKEDEGLAGFFGSKYLSLEAGTGLALALSCSPGHLHLGSFWSGAPADFNWNFLRTKLLIKNMLFPLVWGGGHTFSMKKQIFARAFTYLFIRFSLTLPELRVFQ